MNPEDGGTPAEVYRRYLESGQLGFLIVEAVRQLRGECGRRQVENANVALVHGNGGVLSSQVTAILGSESTLRTPKAKEW